MTGGTAPTNRSHSLHIQWDWIAAGFAALVSLSVFAWEYRAPEYLSFYDIGVYVASAIKFVSGVLPYRNYTLVQPPGLVYALLPEGVIGHIFGSHDAFSLARLASGLISAVNASLLSLLLRRWGPLVMAAGGATFAVLPIDIYLNASVELETYTVFCALLGAVILTRGPDGVRGATRRRVMIAGLILGLGVSIKLIGALAVVGVLLFLLVESRQLVRWLLGAAAGSFVLVTLPFAALAPRSFFDQVIVAQLFRHGDVTDAMSLHRRLNWLSGLAGSSLQPQGVAGFVFWAAVIAVFLAALSLRAFRHSNDRMMLASLLVTGAGLLALAHVYNYYFYVASPYVVGVIAIAVACIARRLSGVMRIQTQAVRRLIRASSVVALVLGSLGASLWVSSYYSAQAWAFGYDGAWIRAASTVVPRDSCVIYEIEAIGVLNGRLGPTTSNCPQEVDSYGLWLAAHSTPNLPGPPPRTLVQKWRHMLGRAQYVVFNNDRTLGVPHDGAGNIPWTRQLWSWFTAHYRRVYSGHYMVVFRRE